MPKKDIRQGITQAAGRSTPGRKKGHQALCPGGSDRKGNNAVFADSIHTVTFKPRSGPEILFIHGAHEVTESVFHGDGYTFDPDVLLADLWSGYKRASSILKPGKHVTHPVKQLKLPMDESLTYILDSFRNLLPRNFLFNIDKNNTHRFRFTIYAHCDDDPEFKYFFIGRAVKKLWRNNKPLHDLFIEFLKCFMVNLDIEPWWNTMDYTFDSIDESSNPEFSDIHKRGQDQLRKCLAVYKTGAARQYERLIKNAALLSADTIQERAARFRKNNPVAQLILEGCEVMKDGFPWSSFDYVELSESEYSDVYLRLCQQAGFAWDYGDVAWEWHEDFLNSEANEGVQRPIASWAVHPKTTEIDFKRLNQMRLFPNRLSNFFLHANNLLKKYERTNAKAN